MKLDDTIMNAIPLMAPVPTAWMIGVSTVSLMDFPLPVAVVTALTVEGIGFVSINTANEMREFNRHLNGAELKQKMQAPVWQAYAVAGLYLATATLMTVVLHIVPTLELFAPLPFILMTGLADNAGMRHGMELGADDYLPKPFEPTLLHARITASLEKKSLRDQQRKLLHTFASEAVAEQLMANGFSLGGKKISASIMFTDIRSFTTLSEKSDAADTIELLNNYFAAIFEPISKHGGIVNQIIGDGLMALFGVTGKGDDHKQQAVFAAMDMIDTLKIFNEKQAAAGKVQIKIGIGIASGVVIAGYAGTQHRATYTCVGDTVNLASRIESHTKVVGKPILIDKFTREKLTGDVQVEDLGDMTFKGKHQAINIYAVKA